MHAAQSLNKNSIATRILLGTDSSLQAAMVSVDLLSINFSQIEALVDAADDVAGLARLGCRTLSDALTECREYADSGDVIEVVDCLSRAVSAHRVAKNLFLAIVELGDSHIVELAQLGVTLSTSVLDDLGA